MIRKYLGWALLGLSIVTLLIFPWMGYLALKEKWKRDRQAETAKILALHYPNLDPYVFLFRRNGELNRDLDVLKQLHRSESLTEALENEGFFTRFYKRAIGEKSSPLSKTVLKEAYKKHSASNMIDGIYNLLKNAAGRLSFAQAKYAVQQTINPPQDSEILSSHQKMSPINKRKRAKKSDQNEFLKPVLMKSQAVVSLEVLQDTFTDVIDKWKEEGIRTHGTDGIIPKT